MGPLPHGVGPTGLRAGADGGIGPVATVTLGSRNNGPSDAVSSSESTLLV
jgi:hypothetical protein